MNMQQRWNGWLTNGAGGAGAVVSGSDLQHGESELHDTQLRYRHLSELRDAAHISTCCCEIRRCNPWLQAWLLLVSISS